VIGLRRRGRAALVAVGAAAIAVGTLGPLNIAEAADTPRVLAVSLSGTSVTVDGLALAQVTVTATVSGWPEEVQSVFLSRTSPASEPSATQHLIAVVQRSSGDSGSGTYAGTLYVPSSAEGRWRVDAISDAGPVATGDGSELTRDPRGDGVPDAVLAVTGAHPPLIRLAIEPTPVPYPSTRYTAVATYSDATTGKPIVGRLVGIGFDNDCADGFPSTHRTDAHGRFRRTITDPHGVTACAYALLPVPEATAAWKVTYAVWSTSATFAVRLSAKPVRTRFQRGSSTTVHGNLVAVGAEPGRAAAAGTHVRLQRLVGRTWSSVNEAKIRSSGRYEVVATPPGRGRFVYRVWFPSQYRFKGTVTKTFSLTAT
jgi:hypothetical protein